MAAQKFLFSSLIAAALVPLACDQALWSPDELAEIESDAGVTAEAELMEERHRAGPSRHRFDVDAGVSGGPRLATPPVLTRTLVLDESQTSGPSLFCGDGIQALQGEECDDGNADTGDACSVACQVTDFLAKLPGAAAEPRYLGSRYLGEGRHPVTGGAAGFGVVYVEPDALDEDRAQVGLSWFDDVGVRGGDLILSVAEHTPRFANPVIAPLPGGRFAIAWNDFEGDGDELGVALAEFEPLIGQVERSTFANLTRSFSQRDADVLWASAASGGGELVVAWEDDSRGAGTPDIRYRTFNGDLFATSGEQILAATDEVEGNVALGNFGDRWVAAWRERDGETSESIVVKEMAGGTLWRIEGITPGSAEDRPAIAELDATHLLVVFTEGTDPAGIGIRHVARLRYAVLDTADPLAISVQALEPLAPALVNNGLIELSQPSLARAGTNWFISWRSRTDPLDPDLGSTDPSLVQGKGEDVWLKLVTWEDDGTGTFVLVTDAEEMPLPRLSGARFGDQRFAGLGSDPLGTLIAAWDDYGQTVDAAQGQPDVVVQISPDPTQRPPPVDTTCTPEEPCESGEGPCSDDADCAMGALCVSGVAQQFGLNPDLDVCVLAHCLNGVQDVDETGIDCGGSCTSSCELVDEDFDDEFDGWVYADDTFQGTAQPAYADGVAVDGKLTVDVGGVDDATVLGMSGGWSKEFVLLGDGIVAVSFDYFLDAYQGYEPDEFSEVLVSIDGVLYGVDPNDYVVHVAGGGTAGWATVAVFSDTLSAGVHTVTIGAYNNKKTFAPEATRVELDNVNVTRVDGVAVCGNGVIEPGEECDDQNSVETDACTSACLKPVCGDGAVNGSEDCDDANSVHNDSCNNLCAAASCADGVQNQGEESIDCGGPCSPCLVDTPLIDADFADGAGPFTYSDDTFRGTNQPDYADGNADGGYLEVNLGDLDDDVIDGLSGGWSADFVLDGSSTVSVSFDYFIDAFEGFEPDEFSEVLVSIDGVLYGVGPSDYVVHIDGGGTAGWVTFTFDTGVLAAGTHTITLGGFNNRKTFHDELTVVRIDNVLVTRGPVLDVDFEDGAEGFTYSDDTFRGTNQPNYADGAAQNGQLSITLGGVDDATVLGMSGGWSTNFELGSSGRVRVSFDYFIDVVDNYEPEEFAELLVAVDGVLYGVDPNDYVVHIADGGTAGWATFTFETGILSSGSHVLTIGGFNNQKTINTEFTTILIDDVRIVNTGLGADDFADGAGDFVYVDDAFRGTAEPAYADGVASMGQLSVTLGSQDDEDIFGMSGGWRRQFSLETASTVTLSFDYLLDQDIEYEDDELSQLLVDIDGVLYGVDPNDYVVQLAGGGATGWVSFSVTSVALSAGVHTLTIGAYNNKKTTVAEETILLIDNVQLDEGPLISTDFSGGAQGFSYADDTFRGSSEPDYASGVSNAGYLEVTLGALDDDDILGMSGGWSHSFELASESAVSVSFDYSLFAHQEYEPDEFSEVLVSIDGVLYGIDGADYVAHMADGGTTGWVTFTFTSDTLAAGAHTLTIGGFNNKKTFNDEVTIVQIDNVDVVRGPLLNAEFSSGTGGFSYADDSFRATTAPVYASGGLSGGELQVVLGGIDVNDIFGLSGGHSRSFTLSEPRRVDVSFDYTLDATVFYELDEFSEVLVSIDGVLYGTLGNDFVVQIFDGGNIPWATFSFVTERLAAGPHTITLGAYNNQKTWNDEITTARFDNVRVE